MIETLQVALCRKPVEGSCTSNLLDYGVVGINIAGCRIGLGTGGDKPEYKPNFGNTVYGKAMGGGAWENIKGRFPTNIILEGSESVVSSFPDSIGAAAPVARGQDGRSRGIYGDYFDKGDDGATFRATEEQRLDSFGDLMIESFHISVCMKPIKSDFLANLLEHDGEAGINIDESRVLIDENLGGGAYAKVGSTRHDGTENWRYKRDGGAGEYEQPKGRFPANVMHDGSEIMDLLFPDTGFSKGGKL